MEHLVSHQAHAVNKKTLTKKTLATKNFCLLQDGEEQNGMSREPAAAVTVTSRVRDWRERA